MTRLRVASALAVVAVLAVLAGTTVAVVSYVGRDDDRHDDRVPASVDPRATLAVRDPASGATFEVPAGRWAVEPRRVRVYYEDDAGDVAAVVRGPAVYRQGYCTERAAASNRAFAGFTREPFSAWVAALGSEQSRTVQHLTLPDGTAAELRWALVDPVASGRHGPRRRGPGGARRGRRSGGHPARGAGRADPAEPGAQSFLSRT
jgi:hypothetical protein